MTRAALQDQSEVVGRGRLIGPMDFGPADAAAPHGDQALGLQDAQGLTDRRIADAELAHQLVLGGKPIEVRASENALAKVSGDRLRDAALGSPSCGHD